MKKLLAIIMLILGLFVFVGCGGSKDKAATDTKEAPKQLKKFNVGYLPSAGHVLYFVAKEKGYFQEEGLDVELFQFTNSGEGLNAIQSGKVDAGSFGTAGPLTFISKGTDFTIFGGQQTEGHAIIAQADKAEGLKDLKNFKGKTVATVRLATGDVVFRGAALEAGLDWKKDLTIKELDSPAAVLEAVKKGSVDAGLVWTPYIAMAQKQGIKVVKYSDELVKGHTCCRQVAVTSKIKDNPQDYENFMRALIKAYKFYQTNHDETIDDIAKYVKIDKEIIKESTYNDHIISNPDPDKPGVIKFWSLMNKAGYIKSDIKIEDKINVDIYKKALDSLLKENPNDKTYKKLKDDFMV